MEDYGLNEAISYANLMIILFVCINLIHFPCSRQIFLPSDDLRELSKNNSSINNKNNIRTHNERSEGKGTQAIASITPLHYMDPFIGITPGSREVDY